MSPQGPRHRRRERAGFRGRDRSDWVVLEPVDDAWRPTPPGQPSHTVLLTNLADRIQPIIRYDHGDTVILGPEPCPCGSPFPVIQLEGRRDDVLRLVADGGRSVATLPLAIDAALESAQGIHRGQIIQAGPSTLRVRLECEPGHDPDAVWRAVLTNLQGYLSAQGLAGVRMLRADEPPAHNPRSGKFRQVIAGPATGAA